MASSAISKAIRTLEAKKRRDVRERIEGRMMTSELTTKGSAAAGVIGAAFVDRRMGSDESPATFGDSRVPINATVGVVGVVGSYLLPRGMVRDVVGGAAFGAGMAALYRGVYDNLPDEDDED